MKQYKMGLMLSQANLCLFHTPFKGFKQMQAFYFNKNLFFSSFLEVIAV